MAEIMYATAQQLAAALDEIRQSPQEEGVLHCIVRRPGVDEREVLAEGELSLTEGLVGDNWLRRGSNRTADGSAHPEKQLNIMNARAIARIAGEKERWALAGDQLYVDLDLSLENLPVGTRLSIGPAEVEITAPPHTGCKKFAERFGLEAMQWVNSEEGKQLRLRGLNAKVVRAGAIRVGDRVKKCKGSSAG